MLCPYKFARVSWLCNGGNEFCPTNVTGSPVVNGIESRGRKDSSQERVFKIRFANQRLHNATPVLERIELMDMCSTANGVAMIIFIYIPENAEVSPVHSPLTFPNKKY